MKKIPFSLVLAIVSISLFAQEADDQAWIPQTTAQQRLKEISVHKMEDAGFWYSDFSSDFGLLELRDFPGNPLDKEPIEDELNYDIAPEDKNVLGAKVSFYRRGVIDFVIKPIRPLAVEGIAKTVSVWVVGRNINHSLELFLTDAFGNDVILPMGKLNFVGWRKMTVSIPPHIKQVNYRRSNDVGITIEGFNVKCDIDETYGRYYIYFDDVRVVSDLFAEESREVDDMTDAW